MCSTIQEQSNFLHMHIGKPSGIPVVAPVVELCDHQVTLLLVVVSWQYSCLIEVDLGVSNAGCRAGKPSGIPFVAPVVELAVSSMAVSDTLPWCRLDYHTQEWDTDFRANLKQLDSKKPLILCTNRTAHTLKHS